MLGDTATSKCIIFPYQEHDLTCHLKSVFQSIQLLSPKAGVHVLRTTRTLEQRCTRGTAIDGAVDIL